MAELQDFHKYSILPSRNIDLCSSGNSTNFSRCSNSIDDKNRSILKRFFWILFPHFDSNEGFCLRRAVSINSWLSTLSTRKNGEFLVPCYGDLRFEECYLRFSLILSMVGCRQDWCWILYVLSKFWFLKWFSVQCDRYFEYFIPICNTGGYQAELEAWQQNGYHRSHSLQVDSIWFSNKGGI